MRGFMGPQSCSYPVYQAKFSFSEKPLSISPADPILFLIVKI